MASVELLSVSRRWGAVTGVEAVSLDVADGEFVVLLGPSGCGKSTTMRMIAGLEDPSEGEIRIGGRVVNELPPGERDLAMVFQNYGLYPHMTVAENIGYPLKVARVPREEREARVQRGGRAGGARALSRPAAAGAVGRASGSGWRWGGRSSGRRSSS